MTRTLAPPVLVTLVLGLASVNANAETLGPLRAPHIRTTDPRLLRLLREGVQTSETFRRLVDRLKQSDVVVYLECDGPGTTGRLSFVSAIGGYRYVLVRVGRLASRDAQIGLIGHELQHAVEIAEAPKVVDDQTLAHEYRRIGFENPRATSTGLAFDSVAAVDTGYQVLHELSSVAGD